jgi:hypothetical protein
MAGTLGARWAERMIKWNDLLTHIVGGVIIAVVVAVAGSVWLLWKNRYSEIVRWLLERPWVVVSTLIAIAGLIVFGVVETQLAQLKNDLSTISPEANGPAAKLSQVSDLAEALAKVHWIDTKLKEFEEAAARYEETYKENSGKNTPVLNIQAASTIEMIAKDVLKKDYDLHTHPHFDANHFCCYVATTPMERDVDETFNSFVDEHNTATLTFHDIRKELLDERTKYEAVIEQAVQK